MKAKNYVLLLMLLFVLPSCGSGGKGSDTMGVLSLTTPTVTGGKTIGSAATVSFTVTYTPPPGKDPNGVVIHTKILNGSGAVVFEHDVQLYSNTSYDDGFVVKAISQEQLYIIELSIGTMTAGSSVVIPAGT